MTLPRRAFLGCAAAAGCSMGRAADTAPVTVPATEIPVGSGKPFAEQATVLQPNPGEFHPFAATCTRCTVNEIRDGVIRCPCHGSRFRITDGSAERGPAQEPLTRCEATLHGTDIRIT